MMRWIIAMLVLMAGLAHGAASDWQIVQVNTSTAAINLPLNLYGVPMLASNNTFAAGTTQSFDSATVTNLTMQGGNIALGSGYLSGDGGNEGVSVDSSGNVRVLYAAPHTDYRRTLASSSTLTQESASNGVASAPYFMVRRYSGSISAPGPTSNTYFGVMGLQGHDGVNVRNGAQVYYTASQDWATNALGSYIRFLTIQNGGTSVAEAMSIREDKAVRLYNMTTGPTTGSGYIVHGASNNVAYVWNGAGVRTQLTSHNESNELCKIDYDEYTGIGTEINLQYMAEVLEEMLPKDHKYKGKLIIRTTNETAIADWRANEARQAAERSAEIAAWEQADSEHKAKLAKWQAIPMADKARLTPPTKEDDRPKPEPYAVRPIPTWAVGAQGRFDVLYEVKP